MTNRDRVLKGVQHRQAPVPPTWTTTELKRFWALARKAGMSKDGVRILIEHTFDGKERLHDLTRAEFLRLLNDLVLKQTEVQGELDRYFAGTPMRWSWSKIRWLQRQLKWTDGQLINYIKWHGRKGYTSTGTPYYTDHIRWLTVDKAHGIIAGMLKINKLRKPHETSQNN